MGLAVVATMASQVADAAKTPREGADKQKPRAI